MMTSNDLTVVVGLVCMKFDAQHWCRNMGAADNYGVEEVRVMPNVNKSRQGEGVGKSYDDLMDVFYVWPPKCCHAYVWIGSMV